MAKESKFGQTAGGTKAHGHKENQLVLVSSSIQMVPKSKEFGKTEFSLVTRTDSTCRLRLTYHTDQRKSTKMDHVTKDIS